MAFRRVQNNVDQVDETDVNQYADAFNGTSGKGQPLDLTQLDADRFYLVVKNLNVNGKCIVAYKPDGTTLFQLDVNGLIASQGGAAASALAPSASPTFTGIVTTNGSTVRKIGTSTPSAATLTIPTDGETIPITGAVAITAFTAGTATRVVTLQFATAGCVVKAAAGILQGDYISVVGGTLTLGWDGVHWCELGRGAHAIPGARYFITAATQSITSGGERIISWTNSEWNYGLTSPTTSAPIPGILGRWKSELILHRDGTAASDIKAWLLKNGTDVQQLIGVDVVVVSTGPNVFVVSREFEVSSITDTYGIGLTSGNTADIIGLTSGTSWTLTYLGR